MASISERFHFYLYAHRQVAVIILIIVITLILAYVLWWYYIYLPWVCGGNAPLPWSFPKAEPFCDLI